MNGELDWILAQDEETGRFVRKPKRLPAEPREREPPRDSADVGDFNDEGDRTEAGRGARRC